MSELTEHSTLTDVWLAAWGASDAELFSRCCTPDVSYEDPLTPELVHGIGGVSMVASTIRSAFPDLRIEPTGRALADGEYACVPWRLLGTHRGQIATLPATNRFVTLHGLHYLELSDGLVRRARGFFDLYDVGSQVGVLPERGGLGETAMLLLRGFGLRR